MYEHEKGVITVLPEAWEFIPEGRGSPVKLAAEMLIRKGASLGNFVWIDSQDMAGVWKLALRAATVWLIGVQREANELTRTLANIPASVAKPGKADVASLERGEFYACFGKHVIKTYVQPVWMNQDEARSVATGFVATGSIAASPPPPDTAEAFDDEPEKEDSMSKEDVEALRGEIRELAEAVRANIGSSRNPQTVAATAGAPETFDEEALYQRFKKRLAAEAPALLKVLTVRSVIEVEAEHRVIEVKGDTLRGKLALMVKNGFFNPAATGNAAFNDLQRTGFGTAKPNVYKELDKLTAEGFLTKEGKEGYLAVDSKLADIVTKPKK